MKYSRTIKLICLNICFSVLFVFNALGQATLTKYVLKDTSSLNIGTYDGVKVIESGFSSLHYIPNSTNQFYVTGDRGPNLDAGTVVGKQIKIFPFPNYGPKILKVKLVNDSVRHIPGNTVIKRPGNVNTTGIPNPEGQGGTGEIAWTDSLGTVATRDIWGVDPEGIVEGKNNDWWVAEKYGTCILNINKSNGNIINRYTPFGNSTNNIAIDTMFKKRVPNRGFAGIAFSPDGKVYAITQSPLANPNKAASDNSRLHRIIAFNPDSNNYKMYAYEHDAPVGGSTGIRNEDWRIGDLVAINDKEFLITEYATRGGFDMKNIYKIDISSATPINKEAFQLGKTFEMLNTADSAISKGIIPVTKTLFLNLVANGWQTSHPKPSGLTIMNDSTIALINNANYGIDAPANDGQIVATGESTKIYVYSLPPIMHLNVCSQVKISSNKTTLCKGDSVKLTNNSSEAASFTWKHNATSISSLDSLYYTANSSGVITLTTVNGNGCIAKSNKISITVNELPGDSTNPVGSLSSCVGQMTVLEALHKQPKTKYQWRKNGTNVSGATSAFYQVLSSGTYAVDVIDSNTCKNTSPDIVVTLNSIPAKPVVTVSGNVLTAPLAASYLWYRNYVPIDSATSQEYTITEGGIYFVQVKNVQGCANNSDPINIVGIADIPGLTNLVVKPNPVKDFVNVEFNLINKSKLNIELHNSLGQKVLSIADKLFNPGNQSLSLSVKDLEKGIYFMIIRTNDQVLKHKLVKVE